MIDTQTDIEMDLDISPIDSVSIENPNTERNNEWGIVLRKHEKLTA